MSRIGFLGTGHIAAPMARHLAAKGHEVMVTRRSEAVSSALARDHGVAVGEAQEVLDASDVVILCLRPDVAAGILEPLQFRERQQVVSAMAAISTAELERLCAPAGDFVRFIPLGFLETGGCPLAGFGNDALLTGLFAPENPVVALGSEDHLNAHFAVTAMVPGMLDMLSRGADWLADQTGDTVAAEFFTSQLMAGFLTAMEKHVPGHLGTERDALATEGTLSLQMVQSLRRAGAGDGLATALTAIAERLNKGLRE